MDHETPLKRHGPTLRLSEEADADDLSGWDKITEWTGGIDPNTVDDLREMRAIEPLYPLLHALVGRSLRDFLVRAAALRAIVAFGRANLGPDELDEALWWLDARSRDAVLRTLRASGWLEWDPARGTTPTNEGRWAYDVLSFLQRRLAESELLPTIAGIDYALRIGVDPVWHLDSLRSRLTALRDEIDAARASHSEVILRRTSNKLDEALSLSAEIRAVLDRVPLDHRAARRSTREIHELLSLLHGAGAELHASITEVGRQYLRLTAGLTVEQIVRALMRRSCEDLAAVGRDALLPVFAPPPLLTTEVLATAAEQHMLRERKEAEPVVWDEPPDPARASDADLIPHEVLAFLADLGDIVRAGESTPLARVIPRGDSGESFLRASLLPLVGDRRAGEGVAGQLGSLSLKVETEGDGSPEPIVHAPITALTPGHLCPPGDGGDRG
jgi:hypothetical protein